jgi:hypothetical protein
MDTPRHDDPHDPPLAALSPGSPANLLLAREKEPAHSAIRLNAMSLGCGDKRAEGDMGLEPDGLPSPHPGNTPFHNMALMSPATTAADVDRHAEMFEKAVDELIGRRPERVRTA